MTRFLVTRMKEFLRRLLRFGKREFAIFDKADSNIEVRKTSTVELRGPDMSTPGMPDRVVVYKDGMDQWRWHRKAPNGKIVADGGEGYHNRVDCVEQATSVNALPYILEMDGSEGTITETYE